jgi:hypothetical protein
MELREMVGAIGRGGRGGDGGKGGRVSGREMERVRIW